MRFWVTLVLSGSLIVGCAEDGSENPRSSCLTDGAGGTGGASGVNPSSPFLQDIAWDPIGFCQQGARNNYNIFVFAGDPDTPLLDLIFEVNVPDCSPVAHAGNVFVVSCPNDGPTTGVACAEDPDGNVSSRVAFTFQVCEPGSCLQTPDACDMLAVDRP